MRQVLCAMGSDAMRKRGGEVKSIRCYACKNYNYGLDLATSPCNDCHIGKWGFLSNFEPPKIKVLSLPNSAPTESEKESEACNGE